MEKVVEKKIKHSIRILENAFLYCGDDVRARGSHNNRVKINEVYTSSNKMRRSLHGDEFIKSCILFSGRIRFYENFLATVNFGWSERR